MRPLVFIGPTLSRRRCSALLSAEYLPPARKGSLNEVTPGRVVAIIDGEIPPDAFLPECEVRAALDRDVVLFGAASVGAYHASNFADHGMHGVGWVYDQYRAGALASFDEIAVMYDPVSLRALSVPLVNVRFWLEGLIAAISSTTRRRHRHFGRATPAADIRPRCSEDQEMYSRAFRPFRAKKIRLALGHVSRC